LGYLIIVKWNRFVKWNRWRPRRGLTHGIWLVDAAGPAMVHDDMLKLRLDSDREHRYPVTAPGSLEFGSQATAMYVTVTPRGNPARAGTRQFLVRISRIHHRPPPTDISGKKSPDPDSAARGSQPGGKLPLRNSSVTSQRDAR
jgi:hypothetical protein